MEFQNQPFQDLKDRVDLLEKAMEKVTTILEGLTESYVQVAAEKPQAVREEQDDAGGKPFFSPVGAIQKTNEQGS